MQFLVSPLLYFLLKHGLRRQHFLWISVGLRGARPHLKSCTDSRNFPPLAVCGKNSALREAPTPQSWSGQALPGRSMPEFGHYPNLSTRTHTLASFLRQWSTTESLGSWGGGCPGQAQGCGGLHARCNHVTLPSCAEAELLGACCFRARGCYLLGC